MHLCQDDKERFEGRAGDRPPFKSLPPSVAPNEVLNGCIVQRLCSSLCLAFSDADIEFDIVLMTMIQSVSLLEERKH